MAKKAVKTKAAKKRAVKKPTVKKTTSSAATVRAAETSKAASGRKPAARKRAVKKKAAKRVVKKRAVKKKAASKPLQRKAASKPSAKSSPKSKPSPKKSVNGKSKPSQSSAKSQTKSKPSDAGERQKTRSANYQRRIAAATREIGSIPAVFDPERRESCRHNLKLYLETYTPKAVRLGWSDDHLELIDALQKIMLDGGQLAIGMPRGTGKTTIVIRAIMWAISYGHHSSVCLIAATDPKARKALRGMKKEFETSLLLLEDFPEIAFPIRCLAGINNRQSGQTSNGKPTLIKWGIDELTFPTIKDSQSSGARVVVGGITGAVTRGEQETNDEGEVIRPSLILIDDPQTRESAKSPDQVQTRMDIIEADIAGMAGPDETLSMLATVTVIYPDDVADQILDVDLMPDWNGIRKKFMLSMPSNLDLWEQYKEKRRQSLRLYRDIRQATAFYAKNRKAMDAGAAVSWEARYRRKLKWVDGREIDVKEISAIQHAMEWYLVKPGPFASELQNEPEARHGNNKNWLTAKQIAKRIHPSARGIVPQRDIVTHSLFGHIDVHEDLLYWAVGAISQTGSAGILDNATYPKQRSRYFRKSDARATMLTQHGELGQDGAIRHSIILTASALLDRSWTADDGHTDFVINLLGIDCGDQWRLVNNCVLELLRKPEYKNRVCMARGFGVSATDTPFAERRNPEGTVLGNNVMMRPRKTANEAPRIDIDTNYWKTQTHDRFATPLGTPGSLTFFDTEPNRKLADHQMISEHCKAEAATESFGKGRTVYSFKQLPQDNHHFDNVVGLLAAGSFRGCDTQANATPQVARKKRKRRTRGNLL